MWWLSRGSAVAMRQFISGLPLALIFIVMYVSPGILLSRHLSFNPWWAVPWSAVLLKVVVEAIANWPPSRWWPLVIVGQVPTPFRILHVASSRGMAGLPVQPKPRGTPCICWFTLTSLRATAAAP